VHATDEMLSTRAVSAQDCNVNEAYAAHEEVCSMRLWEHLPAGCLAHLVRHADTL